MENNTVYLVLEGSEHLSDLVLMGIYSNKDDAVWAIANNHRFGLDELIDFDEDDLLTDSQKDQILTQYIMDELTEHNQIIGDELGYEIMDVELDTWDEIHIP